MFMFISCVYILKKIILSIFFPPHSTSLNWFRSTEVTGMSYIPPANRLAKLRPTFNYETINKNYFILFPDSSSFIWDYVHVYSRSRTPCSHDERVESPRVGRCDRNKWPYRDTPRRFYHTRHGLLTNCI